jgi:hypothetical protein
MELNKKGKFIEIFVAIVFVLIGIVLRLYPHPSNFTPLGALALFGGVYLSRKIALILPIIAMTISDLFIGYYEFKLMIVVYGSFLLCVLLGFQIKNHKKWHFILGGSFLTAVIFFFLTNFAVWAFTSWYPKTVEGIIQCYLLALPFFKNTILGNLFYTTIFFGGYEIIEVWLRRKFKITQLVTTNL